MPAVVREHMDLVMIFVGSLVLGLSIVRAPLLCFLLAAVLVKLWLEK